MDETEFMLQRTISICLTDPKRSLSTGKTVTFSAAELGLSGSMRIFFQPLLHLVNVLRMVRSFRNLVLGFARYVLLDSRRRNQDYVYHAGAIDWERTSESYMIGERRCILLPSDVPWSTFDAKITALTIHEFTEHCRILCEWFDRGSVLPPTSFLAQAMKVLEQVVNETEHCVSGEAAEVLPLSWAGGELSESLTDLKNQLFRACEDRVECSFGTYFTRTCQLFERLGIGVRHGGRVLEWRWQYASRRAGFGLGGDFSYLQARKPAHIFEIWCFVEFANALIENGLEDVVQYSLLRTGDKGPTFQIADKLDAYYNFFSDRFTVPYRPKIFPQTHIEWYILNREEPQKSIIVDTKYRDWASDESLKVLGYMNDFGVDCGVIVYRGLIPSGAIRTDEPDDRFVVHRFGNASQRVFCAMTLRPTEENLEENSRVLKRLIDEVVLPGRR